MAKISKLKSERKICTVCFYLGAGLIVVAGMAGNMEHEWVTALAIVGLIMLGYMFNSLRSLLDEVINDYSA